LCIDQNSSEQKNNEIGRMKNYYKNASACLVFLVSEENSTKLNLLNKIYENLSPEEITRFKELVNSSGRTLIKEDKEKNIRIIQLFDDILDDE
jgi:hypothetical protein